MKNERNSVLKELSDKYLENKKAERNFPLSPLKYLTV